MLLQEIVLEILDSTLNLQGRAKEFGADAPLLGSIPGLDSMAVLILIERLEDRCGVAIDDTEIDGSVFSTVGTLVEYLRKKIPH